MADDVTPAMPEWDIFIKEIRKEMTLKAGQRCTGIRRIFVPQNKMEDVQIALGKALSQTVIGNPLNSTVRMGSLAGETQRNEVKEQVQKLLASSQLIYGSLDSVEVVDADALKGAFISPLLLLNQNPFNSFEPHNIEAFGPVSTLMPYTTIDDAIALSKLGKGSLVSTIVTANSKIARQYVIGAATHHGGILILNNEEKIIPTFGKFAIIDLQSFDIQHQVTEVTGGLGRFAILTFVKKKEDEFITIEGGNHQNLFAYDLYQKKLDSLLKL